MQNCPMRGFPSRRPHCSRQVERQVHCWRVLARDCQRRFLVQVTIQPGRAHAARGQPATLMKVTMSAGFASASTRLEFRVGIALGGDRERRADLHARGAKRKRLAQFPGA